MLQFCCISYEVYKHMYYNNKWNLIFNAFNKRVWFMISKALVKLRQTRQRQTIDARLTIITQRKGTNMLCRHKQVCYSHVNWKIWAILLMELNNYNIWIARKGTSMLCDNNRYMETGSFYNGVRGTSTQSDRQRAQCNVCTQSK